jgi:hypothetical protein
MVAGSYPGQQSVGGAAKVPSVLCYSHAGDLLAAGEEAVQYQDAEEEEPNSDDDEYGQVSK